MKKIRKKQHSEIKKAKKRKHTPNTQLSTDLKNTLRRITVAETQSEIDNHWRFNIIGLNSIVASTRLNSSSAAPKRPLSNYAASLVSK